MLLHYFPHSPASPHSALSSRLLNPSIADLPACDKRKNLNSEYSIWQHNKEYSTLQRVQETPAGIGPRLRNSICEWYHRIKNIKIFKKTYFQVLTLCTFSIITRSYTAFNNHEETSWQGLRNLSIRKVFKLNSSNIRHIHMTKSTLTCTSRICKAHPSAQNSAFDHLSYLQNHAVHRRIYQVQYICCHLSLNRQLWIR